MMHCTASQLDEAALWEATQEPAEIDVDEEEHCTDAEAEGDEEETDGPASKKQKLIKPNSLSNPGIFAETIYPGMEDVKLNYEDK